jgi:death on curing protein
VIHLDVDDLLHIANRVLDGQVEVRDVGLLASAAMRPQVTAFGEDAYPDLPHKAAALLHSIARNHALVDGNKRLSLAATIAYLGVNGRRLTLSNDEAYDLVIAVATSALDDISEIAKRLSSGSEEPN